MVTRLLPLGIAAIAVLAFARLVGCSFTDWDDQGTIWQNPRLNPPTLAAVEFYWRAWGAKAPGQLYTPVTYTAWAAVAAVSEATAGRLSPAVFHGANVGLHAVTAVLVYGLLRRLVGRPWPAAGGALLFALHPVQVEPVGWASGTKDVLCGLFAVAALWAYVAAVGTTRRSRRRGLYAAATGLFVLAMLSKPTAMMVPPMAAAIDVLVLRRPVGKAARWLWPWAVLMIPCALQARAAQPADWASPVPAWTRPLVAADAVAFDVAKVAWPAHLCVDYGRRPAVVVAAGAVYWTWLVPAAVAGLLVWRRDRVLAAAAALCVLPLAPVLGLVPFDFQLYSTVADHYLYLPMVGVALAAAWGLAHVSPRPWVVRGVVGGAVAVLVALGVRSAAQEPTWRDTTSLFTQVLAVNPGSFAACDQMGYVRSTAARAIRGDRRTVPPADPGYAEWRADLEDSLRWYDESLRLNPAYGPSLVNIAINAGQLGEHDVQRAALRRDAALQATLPAGLRADPASLGGWMLDVGDPAGAVDYLDRVLRADPTDGRATVVRNRALAAERAGR